MLNVLDIWTFQAKCSARANLRTIAILIMGFFEEKRIRPRFSVCLYWLKRTIHKNHAWEPPLVFHVPSNVLDWSYPITTNSSWVRTSLDPLSTLTHPSDMDLEKQQWTHTLIDDDILLFPNSWLFKHFRTEKEFVSRFTCWVNYSPLSGQNDSRRWYIPSKVFLLFSLSIEIRFARQKLLSLFQCGLHWPARTNGPANSSKAFDL